MQHSLFSEEWQYAPPFASHIAMLLSTRGQFGVDLVTPYLIIPLSTAFCQPIGTMEDDTCFVPPSQWSLVAPLR